MLVHVFEVAWPFVLKSFAQFSKWSPLLAHVGDPHASFLADFLGTCAIAFPIRLLMLQKCAFRYLGPDGLGVSPCHRLRRAYFAAVKK
jgi:hypothetical protein